MGNLSQTSSSVHICTHMEVGSHTATARKSLWSSSWNFLCQLSPVSAEQVAVEVPGAQEQPWGDSVATKRGPAWPTGAGEARGALEPFICKFITEKNQIKTRESLVAVCRESSEDRVGFPESEGPSVLSVVEAEPCALWLSPG